jgi:hypothetical protein
VSYLKPSETLSELFAGLVVVLTVTLAASVLGGGDEASATTALIGAIGANTAWGIIDASLYLMNTMFDRKRQLRFANAIAANPDEASALGRIRGELDPILEPVTKARDREQLYRSIYNTLAHGEFPARSGCLMSRGDCRGGTWAGSRGVRSWRNRTCGPSRGILILTHCGPNGSGPKDSRADRFHPTR